MANLTLRLVKGSPLTYVEVDDNFTALNDATGHFKNALINGNFDIWQRGTSFTSGAYTADRWEVGAGTGGALTISRQAFTVGQTDVPGEPKYFLRHNHTTGSSSAPSQRQKVESVRTFAGQEVTFSVWMKVSSGTLSVTPQITQNFGTGGLPSSAVSSTLTAVTVTTSWQKFSFTFSVPSISGKTIGTDGNDFLAFFVVFPTSTTFTVDIAQAQVEKGDEATEFERRPLQSELDLCKRYFQTLSQLSLIGVAGSTTSINFIKSFEVAFRASPTVTFATGVTSTTARDLQAATTHNSAGAITLTFADSNSTLFSIGSFTGLTAGRTYSQQGNSPWVFLDAEL